MLIPTARFLCSTIGGVPSENNRFYKELSLEYTLKVLELIPNDNTLDESSKEKIINYAKKRLDELKNKVSQKSNN